LEKLKKKESREQKTVKKLGYTLLVVRETNAPDRRFYLTPCLPFPKKGKAADQWLYFY
jgi:hypothetical protein